MLTGTNSVIREFLALGNPVFSFIKNTAKHVPTYLHKELHIRFMLSDKIVKCSLETPKSLV
jgi:hypothetical protein